MRLRLEIRLNVCVLVECGLQPHCLTDVTASNLHLRHAVLIWRSDDERPDARLRPFLLILY
jgi:hypothetical protein